MYALILTLATYVVWIPIAFGNPEPPTATMVIEQYEQEADIWLGRYATELRLSVASDAMHLSGCFVGEICEEGSSYIGPEDHMSRWCDIDPTHSDWKVGWYVMKCGYANPEIRGPIFDMEPHWTLYEDGSFVLSAKMPFEVDPQ